jgi:beta-phosphoglucomutase-like phosphatase (HAD superfamily)
MSKIEKKTAGGAKAKGAGHAILVELENVGLQGREALCEALRKTLADRGVEAPFPVLARACVVGSLTEYVAKILSDAKKARVSAEKAASDARAVYLSALTAASRKLDRGLVSLLRTAAEGGWSLAAVSLAGGEVSQGMAGALKLDALGVTCVAAAEEDRPFPRADVWLRAAKAVSVPPSQCLALASSSDACRAALSLCMRCVAVPDRFTAYQDFGGTDGVIETGFDDAAIRRILAVRASF